MSTAPSTPHARSKPITVTVQQLATLLAQHRGATFVGFTALTKPESRKTPWGPLKKLVKVSATTGAYYDRALAKAAGRDARDERAWGQHDASCLVEKVNPETGAKTYYLPAQNPRYGRPLYLVDTAGKLRIVPAEQATPFLRARPEAPVVYRDFRLDHLVSLNWNGQRYRVRQEAVASA